MSRLWRRARNDRPPRLGRQSAAATSGESPSRMRARAELSTGLRSGPGGQQRTCITGLRSQAPLMLHAAIAKEPEPWAAHAADFARVCVAAGAAGPIGGDRLRLDVHVGPGSALVLSEASATLLLPGRDGARSRTDFRIHVDSAATLILLPEPIIAAHGCDHLNDVRVELAADARLVMREELLLGRHGEGPGRVRQRIRVLRTDAPVYSQDLELGTATAAAPAVADGHRAIGSLLVVDPTLDACSQETIGLPGDTRMMPLSTGAVVLSTLAGDHLALRRQIAAGLTVLGPPWDPLPPGPTH